MPFLDKIERRWGRHAITNIALYIVIAQALVLLGSLIGKVKITTLLLVPQLVLEGEWWRVFSFAFVPPAPGLFGYLFTAFVLYIFYMMGHALEEAWGAFRFNLFLLLGWFLTVACSFLLPLSVATNAFLGGSVFLAFAFLFPNIEFLLFFVLPVKVKWLAWLTWIFYAYAFATGNGPARLMIIASIGNFLIFFAPEMWRRLRHQKRVAVRRAEEKESRETPRHRCAVCGKTNLSDPAMDFRYCSKCGNGECYCTEHIQNHSHRAPAP